MSRATAQVFGIVQGLFGSQITAPLRGGLGLSLHFAWENGTSLSGGYIHGRGEGAAPSAIYVGGPDYHIGRETSDQSYSRPPIPNREMVPSPWPWLWERLKSEWNEAELANEAHRQGHDWLNDECFLYEEGKYDRPLRHLGKRDKSGKFCEVDGTLVPYDQPLHQVGNDLVPAQRSPTPSPSDPSAPAQRTPDSSAFPPPNGEGQGGGVPRRGLGGEDQTQSSPIRKEVPKEETQVSSLQEHSNRRRAPGQKNDPEPEQPPAPAEKSPAPLAAVPSPPNKSPAPPAAQPTLGESATQFARGFAKGVGEESRQIYNDTKELPARLAKTGQELAEDLEAGRDLRALAPLRAATHAIRNASREDAKKIAQAVVDGAVEWYHKPAYEKGESLGRATTAIAAEAAINVLTDGLGTLRKIEKAAEVADHFHDLEKGVKKATHAAEHVRDVEKVAERTAHVLDRPPIHSGKQGKHIPSHNNFEPGRSTLHADPETLAAKAGTGEPIGKLKVGQPGSKERVQFDGVIGDYVDEAGVATPTRVGIIHYAKDGIHIVPGRPK